MSYVGAAESLVARGTYRIPMSDWSAADSTEPLLHFPPAFPTVIALPIALGVPPIQAARWIICLSAFAGAALLFVLVESAAGLAAAAIAVAAMFVAPAVFGVYLAVLSEPLFIALLLATVLGMVALRHQPPNGPAGLLVALGVGLATAAAMLTRYAGAALVGAAVVWPFLLRAGIPFRRRLTYAALALAPAAVAGLLWVERSVRVSATAGGAAGESGGGIRTFRLYGGLGSALASGAATLRDALVPGSGATVWRSVSAIALTVVVATLFWSAGRILRRTAGRERIARSGAAGTLLAVVALTGTSCLLLLVAARAVADPGIPFDSRILAPIVVLLELAVVVALAVWWRHAGSRRSARSAVVALGVAWVAASAAQSGALVVDALTDGRDLAEARFRRSATIDWVRAYGQGNTIYTNWPAALYLHAHRPTHDLPQSLDALTLRRFRERLVRQHGVVVAINVPNPEMAAPNALAATVPLTPIARLPDGTIWGP